VRLVIFRPAASADAREARTWSAERRAEVARRFVANLSASIALIAERPLAFQVVCGETRRVVLGGFPYAVYFRITSTTIVVLAVHGKQEPGRWQSRR
jgi:plasmid stabilization system protein ParE